MNMIPLLAALALLGLLYACQQAPQLNMLAITPGDGDEDIKIAGDHFSQAREDAAELAAQDFLRQKDSGNIEKARALGVRFAQVLLHPDEGPLSGELRAEAPLLLHHQYLLYSYVVNHIIADHSPDSILAQTSLNIFYAEIEEKSPALYTHISDMAAFSMYILCNRSRERSDDAIGRTFAGFVSKEEDAQMVNYAGRLYDKIYRFCIGEISLVKYSDV